MLRWSKLLVLLVFTGASGFARNDILHHKLTDGDLNLKLEWHDVGPERHRRGTEEHELTEADFYDLSIHRMDKRATKEYRPGSSTETHSCDKIRAVPSHLREPSGILPNGLDKFYQKYTEAYGIPVLGSDKLPDDALKRACYVTRFLFADHSGVREWYYKLSGRIAVMGVNEVTTDIPEHSNLDPKWDTRARGLGATDGMPVCTGAEENVLCYEKDRYGKEDIFLHETCHGLHWLGANYAISGWNDRLKQAHSDANATGLWNNTYAIRTFREYFAEGAQSFFNCNSFQDPPNGVHNSINTNDKLKNYDPKLYSLIKEVFPCGNTYLKRCETTREEEMAQQLKMNCNPTKTTSTVSQTPKCTDSRAACVFWARIGECSKNPGYMLKNCRKSCNNC